MRIVSVTVRDRRRAATAVAVAAFHIGAAWLVLSQPLAPPPPPLDQSLAVFDVVAVPPPPPEAPAPQKARAPKPEGAAAPANRRAAPKPVVAPKPPIELPPSPIIAPPIAADGPAPDAGSAPQPGPGTGAGGEGAGLGSGRGGAGTGGGGGRGAFWLKGRIKDSDYPRAASRAGVGGTVVAHFDVAPDGRTRNCRVVQSSGHPDLDATTCRLIEKRFRYRPATDPAGRPVPDVAAWRQTWWLEERG